MTNTSGHLLGQVTGVVTADGARCVDRRVGSRRSEDRGQGPEWLPTQQIPDRGPEQRAVWHDVHHQLATVGMLISAALTESRLSTDTRRRLACAEQENRLLAEMLRPVLTGPGPVELVDLDEMCRALVDTFDLVGQASVALTAGVQWVQADRLSLRRALQNLIGNAVRAAGPAGLVDIVLTGTDDWVSIAVCDDGPGFGRAPAGIASLGMRIVEEFVTRHDGRLLISERPDGSGCRVCIDLPAQPLRWVRPAASAS